MVLTFLFGLLTACVQNPVDLVRGDLAIAPMPANMTPEKGFFHINRDTWMQMDSFPGTTFDPLAVFHEVFLRKSGYQIPLVPKGQEQSDAKHLILIVKSPVQDDPETYRLSIKPYGIIITAPTTQGVFYAMQTLRQIMRIDALPDREQHDRSWVVPAVEIRDQPEFAYRGMHLDVCRHFMPVDFVKKYIDLLAYYKMNRFHWHLTEDQGWRIEIKKYPLLQEVAAWRKETRVGHYTDEPVEYDGTRHGGYYTQEEIREVVRYAAQRGVVIIPEIEMPGHCLAALAAYPSLACTPGPFEVATTWGVFEDVFCPYESTFTFLQDVLDEVMDLFPSPYIHIGGDECPKVRWKESAFCQELMRKENLRSEEELQSYFIRRIEKYLNSKGRNIIGWDEILEGGLAPHATVMSWRGMEGGIEAAKAGHQVIMSPGSHCYFDHYQAEPDYEPLAIGGLTTLEKVYSFNPIPESLNQQEAKLILGAQANLWTEYIPTPDKAEYMAYPRAIALAEALWTPPSKKDYASFVLRLASHLERLDGMGVRYAQHLRVPLAETRSVDKGLEIVWQTPLPRQTVFFARDTQTKAWSSVMTGDTVLVSESGSMYYKTDYSSVREIKYVPSKSRHAVITAIPVPHQRYPGGQGLKTLKDGLTGKPHFNGRDWCAWRGAPFILDLDFGELTSVDSIILGVLSSPGSWIYPPESVEVKGSSDGLNYQTIAMWQGEMKNGRQDITFRFPGSEVRFIRLLILPVRTILPGKPGAGQPGWTFLDEIQVF